MASLDGLHSAAGPVVRRDKHVSGNCNGGAHFAYGLLPACREALQGEHGSMRSQLAPGVDVRRETRKARHIHTDFLEAFSALRSSSRRAFTPPSGWPRYLAVSLGGRNIVSVNKRASRWEGPHDYEVAGIGVVAEARCRQLWRGLRSRSMEERRGTSTGPPVCNDAKVRGSN